MEKVLSVPKWELIVWLKIPQMPQNSSDQFVRTSPKVLDINEKRLHWASVVCDSLHRRSSLSLRICPHKYVMNSKVKLPC